MMLLPLLLVSTAFAEEPSLRDQAVHKARKVESAVIKELSKARDGACHAVKGKDCVPANQEEAIKQADKKSP